MYSTRGAMAWTAGTAAIVAVAAVGLWHGGVHAQAGQTGLAPTPLAPAAAAAQSPAEARYAPVVALLERVIAREMQEKALPAVSIALVDDQQIVWSKGFGFADPERKQPATAETVYRVGSVSKLFTDIAVMQLVEKGQVDLDAPVSTYLPDFAPKNPFGTPITLRHLMSHRAGLVREPPVGHYFDDTAPSLERTVASLNQTTLVYAPGTRTKYSNAGIAVVGRVLEVLEKRPFVDVLQQQVIAPLGLNKSAFAPVPALMPDLAKAFMWTYHGTNFEAPGFQLGMAPAGSMYSTVTDLGRFMSVLFRGGTGDDGVAVLKPATIDTMWTPQFASTSPFSPPATMRQGYGLGFNVTQFDGQRRVGHNGAIYGFATDLQAFPDSKLGVAIVTTLDGANATIDHIAEVAMSALLRAKNDRPLPEIGELSPVPVEQAKALDGIYTSGDRRLELHARDSRLLVSLANIETDLRSIGGTGTTASGGSGTVNSGGDLLVDGRLAYGARLSPRTDGTIGLGSLVFTKVPAAITMAKPPAPPSRWNGLIGEYGWNHNVLYILEKEGKLHALVEWFFLYPLEELGPDRFAFPKAGLYDGEELRFIRGGSGAAGGAASGASGGQATAVEIGLGSGGVRFARRAVGVGVGGAKSTTFRITPLKPIAELRTIAAAGRPPAESGKRAPDLVELSSLDPSIKYDIRYATTNNFMSTPFYRQARALMQRPAAEAVVRAHRALKAQGFGLLIHDAYRPWTVTKMFWEATPVAQRVFVADPSQGSRHNRGCAVDLTLYDLATGKPIPMVGGYDEFSDRSYPNYPGGTSLQRWHRELLRRTMEAEGFTVFDAEWWHFDFNDWREYPILNIPFEQLSGAKPAA